MKVLEAVNLKKTYLRDLPLYKQILLPFSRREEVKALDSVSVCIESENVLGVVGPNGAGKTTLLRILADLLESDGGVMSICGQKLSRKNRRIRGEIGYVSSDERSFFWRLTGRENLEFFARLYGLSYLYARKRTQELIAEFGFEEKADQLFRDYSAGMRKKVSVMRALLHQPSLLLLDEVTNSLDPGSAKIVREMVRGYVSTRKDCAAVWSTHRLEEISQICDKVVMIDNGRIVSAFPVKDLSQNSDFMLKVENLNGQIDMFCKRTGFKTKVCSVADKTSEILISGIDSRQFSQVVSMAVKDFGAYVIFAGCIKKDPDAIFEDLQFTERLYGRDC